LQFLMVSIHFQLPEDAIPIGGVQKHISRVTDELIKLGHPVTWCYRDSSDLNFFCNQSDVVVAHDFFSYVPGYQEKQIMVFHGWEGSYPIHPEIIQKRREIARECKYSVNVGDYIQKYYGTNPDLVTYGGVADIEPQPGKFGEALWVGRLEEDTCPDIAFEMCHRKGWKLTVCGDGSLRSRLEMEYPNFIYLGFVQNPSELIAKAFFIFASGFLSILEAMRAKKVVFAGWNNDLRRDYLELMPRPPITGNNVASLISAYDDRVAKELDCYVAENYQWSKEQTWTHLARQYVKLAEGIYQP
jgi:hypothetical protein